MRPEDLLPIKTFTELMEATTERLKTLAFRITNLRPGGVFYTLLEMGHQALADLYTLLKQITPQLYLDTATGQWLDFKAAEYGVYRKPALKTTGSVVFTRENSEGNLLVPAGTEVSTRVDFSGNRLKFIITEQTAIPEGELEGFVPVEAEFAGAMYNVGTGMITELLTHIGGITQVRNDDGWITREGTDEESDESLRERGKAAWNNLSAGGTRAAYETWAEEINGVVVVWIDDQHPRGQGSVDVYITSTAGAPSLELLAEVQAQIDGKRPLCANVLTKGPDLIPVDFDIVLYINSGDSQQIAAAAQEIIDLMFRYGDPQRPEIRKVALGFGLTQAQIVANLMLIEGVVNVKVNAPADVFINKNELLVKGNVAVTVEVLET